LLTAPDGWENKDTHFKMWLDRADVAGDADPAQRRCGT
jgi:hypothetical protein